MSSCLSAARRLRQTGPLKRFFSADSSLKYQYPLHNKAPEITRTTSKEALEESTGNYKAPEILSSSPNTVDHFDDLHTLSPLEESSRRELQKQHLATKVTGSTPILPIVPENIPPNVPSSSLEVPTTLQTSLNNGIKVVSQEMYSQVCTVGVLANVGSRHETTTGTCHLLELLAFHSNQKYDDALLVAQQLQDWGATSFANTGREQSLYCLDILRPNVERGMELLHHAVLTPSFFPEEVDFSKRAMEYQAMDIQPEILLGEVLQKAAYGRDQQLGKPHFCPLDDIPKLNADVVRSFHDEHFNANPEGLVIAGAGIGHDELVDMAQDYFGHLEQGNSPTTITSQYRGGSASLQHSSQDGLTRIAIAFQVGGWHSDDLVPASILQTLLGGGNSFSAGGPGKGMYSRLYRQVLNQYHWAESAEAFIVFHDESGLVGMSGSSLPGKTGDVARVLADHFYKLSVDLVTDEELERARNMLKNNVLTQLESRLVLFEDMGRQVLTYGHREDMHTMIEKVNAVTKEDLQKLIQRAMEQPPTIAAVGANLSQVPTQEQVQSWF